jgi:4-amino-4-deoxy-L-arabinose transferase-like glycosyltransferase
MTLKETVIHYRAEILLGVILLLSAFLNLWNLWKGGISNAYYASAVKSTLSNPVAGFFNSLDPAGFITVDKPPVGIWVQALFAAVLGFSGWTIILPQALAGIASVALIYCIVSHPFGKPAGLVAAFALAITPISVAVARNGTMDMQTIFVILLAVWAALKAARERSLPWFLASVVLVGIGFNIKMIQAFIVVPAIVAVYFLGAKDLAWQKRVLHLGIAVVVLLAVSLSWALVVDSIPADQRPYIGGSGDNTVMGLILNYNGAHRLGIGDSSGGPGSGAFSSWVRGMPGQGTGNRTMAAPDDGIGKSFLRSGGLSSAGPDNGQGMQGSSGGAPGGGGFGGGNPGIFRLFQNDLAGDITWLLAFTLIGALAWLRKPRTCSPRDIDEAGYFSEKGLTLLAMLLWLIPGLLYFSFTSGFWHDYYIATIAPPLAALVGTGAAGMYREYVAGSRAGWLLVIAILVTGLIQVWFLGNVSGFAGSLVPLILAGTLASAGLLALMKARKIEAQENHRKYFLAVAIAILFIAPLGWSCTLLSVNSGNLPSAALSGISRSGMGGGGPGGIISGGPGTAGMAGPGSGGSTGSGSGSFVHGSGSLQQLPMPGNSTLLSDRDALSRSGIGTGTSGMTAMDGFMGDRTTRATSINGGPQGIGIGISGGESSTSRLAEYLLAHATNETWILAVSSSHSGADLIIQTGRAVMCLGGFTGSDQVLDVTTLKSYITEGKVRYFLGSASGGGGGSPAGGNSEIFRWVSQQCAEVPAEDWGGSSSDSVVRIGSSLYGNSSSSTFPGSGSATSRGTGGPSGANTLYDCKGYSGQAGT